MTSKLINKTKNGRGNDTRGAGGERRRVLMDTIGVAVLVAVAALATAPGVVKAATLRPGTETGLVGWWKFDEGSGTTAADASINDNRGTLSGTTKPTWVSGKHGKALSFDGSTSRLDASYSSGLAPTNVTISLWFQLSSHPSLYTTLISRGYDGSKIPYIMDFRNDVGGVQPCTTVCHLAFFTIGAGQAGTTTLTNFAAGNSVLNKWYHAVGTFDGSTYNLYLNGELQATKSSATALGINTKGLQVGAFDNNGSFIRNFPGLLDDVRIYNRALSATEVYNLYKSGSQAVNKIQPVRLNQGLVGYWSFDGNTMYNNVADLSGNGNHGLLQPTTATSSMKVAGKIGQGLRFVSTASQYISLSNDVSTPGDFTVSFWVYQTGTYSYQGFVSAQAVGGPWLPRWTDKLALGKYGTGQNVVGNTVIPQNRWVHLALSYNSTAHTAHAYMDGISDSGDVAISAPNYAWTRGFGRIGGNTNYYVDGKLDDVRIYNRALNPTEIKALYNMGQATINKTPVNRLNQGLVGYWTFDGKDTATNIKDVSGNGNHGLLQPTNATSSMKVAGKIGQGLRFSTADTGTSNTYINAGSGATLNLTSNLTMSAWVYPTKVPIDTRYILAKRSDVGNSYNMYISGGTMIVGLVDGAAATRYSTATLIKNSWQHVVVTIDSAGTSFTVYKNGVASAPVSMTAYSSLPTQKLYIGSRNDLAYYHFDGLLDDVRIYNRALSASEVKQLYNMGR